MFIQTEITEEQVKEMCKARSCTSAELKEYLEASMEYAMNEEYLESLYQNTGYEG